MTPTDRKEQETQPAAAPRELSVDEAAFKVPVSDLGFTTTAEITITPDWVGQERALAALELGLGVRHAGFNIYVCGLGGTQREQTLGALLADLTRNFPRPDDRVLVQNFQNRDRPRAFYLPAGQGKQLRRDMQELVEDLKRALPETFRKETFEDEKEQLAERYGHEGEEIAKAKNAAIASGMPAAMAAPPPKLVQLQAIAKKNARNFRVAVVHWETQKKYLSNRDVFTLTQEQLMQLSADQVDALFPPLWPGVTD